MTSEVEARDVAMSAWGAVLGGVKAQTSKLPSLSIQRKLDMDLVAIDAALDAFKTVALAETTKLRHQRNSFSPISKLPVEIMFNIFIECLPDYSRYDKNYRLLEVVKLSSVCQTWRAIAQGTPGLWTILDTRTVLPLSQIILQNSGSALISVVGPIKDKDESETQKSFLAACQHMSQWSSLDITAPYTTDFDLLNKAVVPNLKTLTLLCKSPPRRRVESLCLFRGKTPRLERVRLTRVAMDWDPSMWRNLQSISLKMVEGPDAPLFFDILEACPGLRSLALQRFNLKTSRTLDPTARPPISLPLLKYIWFRSLPLSIIALCLSILKCPAVTNLCIINPKTEGENIQEHLEPIASFVRDFTYRTTSNEHIIEITSEGDTFAVRQPHTSLLGFWALNLEGIGERFCRFFTADPERVVACIGDSDTQAQWSSLECLPGCTTVKAGVRNRNFFRYLGTSTIDDGGIKRWPFPNLHTLIIYGTHQNSDYVYLSRNNPHDALELVMKRYDNLTLEEQDAATGHPAALRKLILTEGCSMDLAAVDVIEMVLGTGTVVHEDEPRPRECHPGEEMYVHWGSDTESDYEPDTD